MPQACPIGIHTHLELGSSCGYAAKNSFEICEIPMGQTRGIQSVRTARVSKRLSDEPSARLRARRGSAAQK
jgi:hypothetical protein